MTCNKKVSIYVICGDTRLELASHVSSWGVRGLREVEANAFFLCAGLFFAFGRLALAPARDCCHGCLELSISYCTLPHPLAYWAVRFLTFDRARGSSSKLVGINPTEFWHHIHHTQLVSYAVIVIVSFNQVQVKY